MKLYKRLALLLLLSLFALAACGTDDESEPKQTDDSDEPKTEQSEPTKDEQDTEDAEEPKEEPTVETPSDNDDTDVEKENVLSSLEESDVLNKEIPEIDSLETDIKVDEKNKRIILFSEKDASEPIYKSIFIKHEKRLKIIHLEKDEEPIYNDIIKTDN